MEICYRYVRVQFLVNLVLSHFDSIYSLHFTNSRSNTLQIANVSAPAVVILLVFTSTTASASAIQPTSQPAIQPNQPARLHIAMPRTVHQILRGFIRYSVAFHLAYTETYRIRCAMLNEAGNRWRWWFLGTSAILYPIHDCHTALSNR